MIVHVIPVSSLGAMGVWDTAFRTNFGEGLRPEDFRPSQLRRRVPDDEPAGGG